MNISFYTASVGAQQQQERLDIHGNNIANINNYGFKPRVPSFSHLMTNDVRAIDRTVKRGLGARLEEAEPDFRQMGFADTGLTLDFAISGDGFFALQDPADNSISYTRDGSFIMSRLGDNWYLTDGLGRYVLNQNNQRIQIPVEETEPGKKPTNLPDPTLLKTEDIGVFDFKNYNGILSAGDNRFIPIEKNGAPEKGTGRIIQGFLERSGADLSTEMTKVVESQRSFSFILRMITTSDEIETTVNNLR